jgi:hypothetical protein
LGLARDENQHETPKKLAKKKKDHFYQSDHNQGLNLFPNSIEQDGTQQSKE